MVVCPGSVLRIGFNQIPLTAVFDFYESSLNVQATPISEDPGQAQQFRLYTYGRVVLYGWRCLLPPLLDHLEGIAEFKQPS